MNVGDLGYAIENAFRSPRREQAQAAKEKAEQERERLRREALRAEFLKDLNAQGELAYRNSLYVHGLNERGRDNELDRTLRTDAERTSLVAEKIIPAKTQSTLAEIRERTNQGTQLIDTAAGATSRNLKTRYEGLEGLLGPDGAITTSARALQEIPNQTVGQALKYNQELELARLDFNRDLVNRMYPEKSRIQGLLETAAPLALTAYALFG